MSEERIYTPLKIQVGITEDLNQFAPTVRSRRTSTQYLVLDTVDKDNPINALPNAYKDMQVKLTITGWLDKDGMCGFRVKLPPVLNQFYKPEKNLLGGVPFIITSCDKMDFSNITKEDIVPTEAYTIWGVLEQSN